MSPPSSLSVEEYLRQLQRVYGPISPAFAAEELHCTFEQALHYLYGTQADHHTWVSLPDIVRFCGTSRVTLRRWVKEHHIECTQRRSQGRGTPFLIHLRDAQQYLELYPGHTDVGYLPRFTSGEQPAFTPTPDTSHKDVDWALARQAAWPMTVERLATAVYGTRSAGEQRKARQLLQRWEAQGRITCFSRGLYDLVRPIVILRPEGYRRRALPPEDLLKLRAHHPEIAHWHNGPVAAAWWAYSRVFGSGVLPILERREPSWLEYLLVRQLHPEVQILDVDAAYEALCREVALYRLVPAPQLRVTRSRPVEVTVENIKAGLVDFKALAADTRRTLQRNAERGRGHTA